MPDFSAVSNLLRMAIEIEKKYVLDENMIGKLEARLTSLGAIFTGEDFEENFLHRGGILDLKVAALRLRKTGDKTALTYKERIAGEGNFKHQIEFETGITDADAAENIIEKLGYRVSVVYEKRRRSWQLGQVEVVLDEVPFGFYMEIEGEMDQILKTEELLGAGQLEVEPRGYPTLTLEKGVLVDEVIESRFQRSKP